MALEKAKAKRSSYLGRLENFKEEVDSIDINNPNEFTCAILEEHMLRNANLIDEFWAVQNKILDSGANDDDVAIGNNFDKAVIKTVAKAKQLLKVLNGYISPNDTSTNESPDDFFDNKKYPTIPLPEFNGNDESWLSFKEQFVDQIHSDKNNIGNLRKHYYLRMCLKGEPKNLIEQVALTADNYEIAWKLLCERYDNTIKLTFNHIKQILHFPNQDSKPDYFRRLLDILMVNKHALTTLKQPVDTWDAMILCICLEKLDRQTITSWEEYKTNNTINLKEFLDFLKHKAEIASCLNSKPINNNKPKASTSCAVINNNQNSNTSCVICKQQHPIYKCTTFLNLSPENRIEKATQLRLCKNCLKIGHKTSDCYITHVCKTCNHKHNTLLHKPVQSDVTNTSVNAFVGSSTVVGDTLLSTALINVITENGQPIQIKALLDSGSQCHLITKALVERLNIKTYKSQHSIKGINQTVSVLSEKCAINIQAINSNYKQSIQCNVIPQIISTIPSIQLNPINIQLPAYIKLADPTYYVPSNIDLLIGSQLFWELIKPNQRSIPNHNLKLHETHLGWLLTGELPTSNPNSVCCLVKNTLADLNKNVQRFWEIEEVENKPVPSIEEEQCENIFLSTYKKDSNSGKFIVSIPLKLPTSKLGNSREVAKKRFLSLEKRLLKDQQLRNLYIQFMREYSSLGHMTKIKYNNESDVFYFPHHGVLRENALTTKLRVVFNGSALTDNNISFNELQYKGAVIQDDLFDLLVRFRQHTYVVSGDIAMMYRQILINPDQRQYQRIFWRQAPTEILNEYELNTVTYGTTSAPFLAKRVLHQIGLDCKSIYQHESAIIIKDFYMDDLLTGCNDKLQLSKSIVIISNLLKNAGFEIRKFASNDETILKSFPSDSKLNHYCEFGKVEPTKTLGLQWNSEQDMLHYRIKKSTSTRLTKRIILSITSQIFDPLGLLAPAIVACKIFVQQMWTYKFDWDKELPETLIQEWTKCYDQLQALNKISVPRHIFQHTSEKFEIHGFSDASQKAYAACIYLKASDSVRLLCSKTRVAPLKTISVPYLELCGAVLLTQLVRRVINALTLSANAIHYWTDSEIVLWWLNAESSRLVTFVSNRVAEIQRKTIITDWHFVNSKDNPADLASRGVISENFSGQNLWWNGPSWLKTCNEYPSFRLTIDINDLPAVKQVKIVNVITEVEKLIDFTRHSSYRKLKNVIARCFIFIERLKSKATTSIELTPQKLAQAQIVILKIAQTESFPDEIKSLKQVNTVARNSSVCKLSPFLDQDDILRVGGRILNSSYNYNKKHPYLLSHKHALSSLIARDEHIRLLHAGPSQTAASIRDLFWITNITHLTKSVFSKCIRCYKVNPKSIIPKMGNLPEPRITKAYPFEHTGIDYGGPILMRETSGRGKRHFKAYISVFVCLVTKAVHLEVITSLQTDAFLAMFKRFSSRRGLPAHVYSDNGTNFVGAHNSLKELYEFLSSNNKEISESLGISQITWHFIPPSAPHFGGLWEAAVKSVKTHIKRVVGEVIFTIENLMTLLCQIESVLNSRPLSPLSSQPCDYEPLTPAHFLVHRRLTSLPEESLEDVPQNRLSVYQHLQRLLQDFWKRWSKEYISTLQPRTKWTTSDNPSLKINDLVLIKDMNSPPLRWPLGRIQELHYGKDGIARVATIATSSSLLKRPIHKLCPLPQEEGGNSYCSVRPTKAGGMFALCVLDRGTATPKKL